MAKTAPLTTRLDEYEMAWLDRKAEESGINRSEVVRAMIAVLGGDELLAERAKEAEGCR